MKCSKCGAENKKGNVFCTSCGETLKQPARRRQKKAAAGNSGSRNFAYVFGALAIGLVAVLALKPEQPAERAPARPARPFSVEVREVASKFLCSCGSCDVPELADCVCPTAIEEKELIEQELNRGSSPREVAQLLDSRYGYIKPQFASLVGGSPEASAPAAPFPSAVEDSGVLPASPKDSSAGSGGLATAQDAREIASRFICACGQCKDHALAECDCKHPRGAEEMKALIQYQISQKRHTVEEIVQTVAYEYGHLKEKR